MLKFLTLTTSFITLISPPATAWGDIEVRGVQFQGADCTRNEVEWVAGGFGGTERLNVFLRSFGNRRAIGSPSSTGDQARMQCAGAVEFRSDRRLRFGLVSTSHAGVASVTRSGLVTIRNTSVPLGGRRASFETFLPRPFFGQFAVNAEAGDALNLTRCDRNHRINIVTQITVTDHSSTSIVSPILPGGGSGERYYQHEYQIVGMECDE